MASTDEGLTWLAAGFVPRAREALDAAVAADPTDARAWKGLVEACRRQEDWPRTLDALDGVANTTRGSADAVAAQVARGRILDRRLGRAVDARKAYERALQLDDTTAFAWLALAELSLRRHKWQMAVANADHGLQFGVVDAELRGWLLACRAVGQRRSTLSVGPTSTFFNRIGSGRDGRDALDQALAAWPPLARMLPAAPLDAVDLTCGAIAANLPEPALPPWWGR